MTEETKQSTPAEGQAADKNGEFADLLAKEKDAVVVPRRGETVKGTVLSASKAEVRLDIDGVFIGVVRGRELYEEAVEYAGLKPGDEIEATVIDEENENGEMELSFRYAGQEKAWKGLKDAFENKSVLKVKVVDANRGGLLANFGQIAGFLPVSQLAPENYPRVSGGDKIKILEKLKSFVGQEFTVKVMNLDEKGEKIIFSEKEAWNERQKDVIAQFKIGDQVTGRITAVTDFGVFVTFGDNLEGLIHISELAWQRIDDPGELYKAGQNITAQIINIDGSKIFLSAKKLMRDPWEDVAAKYQVGQTVKTTILKVNPFGLFVKLDDNIHGLAHVSQLGLAPGQRVDEQYKQGSEVELKIISIEPRDHRLGLSAVNPVRSAELQAERVKNEDENPLLPSKQALAASNGAKEPKSPVEAATASELKGETAAAVETSAETKTADEAISEAEAEKKKTKKKSPDKPAGKKPAKAKIKK